MGTGRRWIRRWRLEDSRCHLTTGHAADHLRSAACGRLGHGEPVTDRTAPRTPSPKHEIGSAHGWRAWGLFGLPRGVRSLRGDLLPEHFPPWKAHAMPRSAMVGDLSGKRTEAARIAASPVAFVHTYFEAVPGMERQAQRRADCPRQGEETCVARLQQAIHALRFSSGCHPLSRNWRRNWPPSSRSRAWRNPKGEPSAVPSRQQASISQMPRIRVEVVSHQLLEKMPAGAGTDQVAWSSRQTTYDLRRKRHTVRTDQPPSPTYEVHYPGQAREMHR